MILRRPISTLGFALALAVLPVGLAAQQAPSEAQVQQVQGWLTELQELHQQLEELQVRALQDPQLSAAQEELGASIRTTMERIDPTLQEGLARAQAIQVEGEAAQRSGDEAKLEQLGAEYQQIQQRFHAVQQQALQQPELMTRVQAFQTRLEARMAQIEPRAEEMIARFQELEMRVMAALQTTQR